MSSLNGYPLRENGSCSRVWGALTTCFLMKSATLMRPIGSRLRGDAKVWMFPRVVREAGGTALG